MAYTAIDKHTSFFNTKLYTGTNAIQNVTGVGHQPDLVWIKDRSGTNSGSHNHNLIDSVRGAPKIIMTDNSGAEITDSTDALTAFASDGFTLGANNTGTQSQELNGHTNGGNEYVSWNWKAGGTAPSQTYVVKVVSDSGNKYRFDDFGTSAVTLDLQEGGTYTFDQADSSNSGHPLRFYTAADKSGGEYTTGVTTNGTPGSSGAYTRITVAGSAPTLYYQCSAHAGMGGQANTNSTFGSSNFSGSTQSTVSVNTTSGFSIVRWSGTGSNTTIGHGLGVVPKFIIVKALSGTQVWATYTQDLGNTQGLYLNDSYASTTETAWWNSTSPTSSVFTVGTSANANGSGKDYMAYVFAEKPGYSKFSSYFGNGSNDGTMVYCGFKPSWILIKQTSGTNLQSWWMVDAKRDPYNVCDENLRANANSAASESYDMLDILSNGFKLRWNDTAVNGSGVKYIYMAFGQTIVGSNNIPCTAR